ncbi:MAG: DNA repair protein RecO [Parcubacteria group bacterium Athens0714_25]|nr:MAG: DNA repair protein RecO [Parcubacteria group bacterium Athens0714_25]
MTKKDFGEADRLYFIFTEEFGMVKAVAQGVRYLKSKLRFNLDLFSFCNFSLVKTKDSWRIIDAIEKEKNKEFINNAEKLNTFTNIASLMIRMIKGEEKNDFIWQELASFLKGSVEKGAEVFFIAKILKNLGYLTDENLPKKQLVIAINEAIKESML